jgi:SAM-dependent methyltransferase
MAASATLQALLAEGGVKACCAALYENHAVRWFLGGELHPGGETSTRRALELLDVGPGDRLLDVGCGAGTSALLAARERGCEVVGIDLGELAVPAARSAAASQGLAELVSFTTADAEALPFADGSFDAVLCECSLSTFPDKAGAVAEMRRVLRPAGRIAIADVLADVERLPEGLRGTIATLACVGGALPLVGYERLLAERRLQTYAVEPLDAEAARLAQRLEDRLRAGRLLELCRGSKACPFVGFDQALDAVRLARRALDEGALGYALIAARC